MASPTSAKSDATSLFTSFGSSVACKIFLPAGIRMPNGVKLKLQPMPKMRSAVAQVGHDGLGLAAVGAPERKRVVLRERALAGERRRDRNLQPFGKLHQFSPRLRVVNALACIDHGMVRLQQQVDGPLHIIRVRPAADAARRAYSPAAQALLH